MLFRSDQAAFNFRNILGQNAGKFVPTVSDTEDIPSEEINYPRAFHPGTIRRELLDFALIVANDDDLRG